MSVNEPFLVSSFELPKRSAKTKLGGASKLLVSHDGGAKEGHAAVAVQGDGVHVLDVSELHTSQSYSLGPSTTFACPAVSRVVEEDGVRVRKTYAAIASGADSGRAVWVWREPLEGPSTRADDKKTVTLSHDVAQLIAPFSSEDLLLALSAQGDVTVMDGDLAVRHTEPRPAPASTLLKSFVYDTPRCTFLPAGRPASHVTIVLFMKTEGGLLVLGYTVGEEVERICEEELEVDTEGIADIGFSETGLISILGASQTITTYQLKLSLSPPRTIRSLPSKLSLDGSRLEKDKDGLSVLSMHSSFLLLAALTADSSSVALLLLDTRYSVVIAQHTLAVPSSLSSASGILVELTPASSSQALLALSPKRTGTRAALYAVPLDAPARSTLAGAMSAASLGAGWLALAPPVPPTEGAGNQLVDDVQQTLIDKVASELVLKHAAQAESAWNVYLKRKDAPPPSNEFIRRLVAANFQPGKPCVPKIIEDLMKRQLLSNAMVPGGLLNALRERKLPNLVPAALKNVIDIPEADVLAALRPVVAAHLQDEGMQVDGPSALAAFLALVVEYPSSTAALRLAIRQSLPEPEYVVAVLEVVDAWLEPSFVSARAHLTATAAEDTPAATVPSIDKIVAFLRATLDASLFALVQYRPARALLQRLSANLAAETTTMDELAQLAAPLEAYARAHAAQRAKKDSAPRPDDWRRKRKAAQNKMNMALGLYQVEDLYI